MQDWKFGHFILLAILLSIAAAGISEYLWRRKRRKKAELADKLLKEAERREALEKQKEEMRYKARKEAEAAYLKRVPRPHREIPATLQARKPDPRYVTVNEQSSSADVSTAIIAGMLIGDLYKDSPAPSTAIESGKGGDFGGGGASGSWEKEDYNIERVNYPDHTIMAPCPPPPSESYQSRESYSCPAPASYDSSASSSDSSSSSSSSSYD